MYSPSGRLTASDLTRWVHNLKVYAAPLLLLYCLYVINNVQTDGFTLSDLMLNAYMQGAVVLYVFNGLVDILKKFLTENNYQ